MEAIWDELTHEAKPLESPAWHKQALLETEHRLATGQEKSVDWQKAKIELRKRFEWKSDYSLPHWMIWLTGGSSMKNRAKDWESTSLTLSSLILIPWRYMAGFILKFLAITGCYPKDFLITITNRLSFIHRRDVEQKQHTAELLVQWPYSKSASMHNVECLFWLR